MIWEDLTLTFLLVNSDVCAINLINLRTTTMKLWRSIQLSIKIDAFLILLTLIKGFLQAHLIQSYLGWLVWIKGKTKHWLIVALLSNSTPFPAFQASGNSSHLAPRWRLSASLAPALCQMIAISISVRRDIGWHRTQAVVLLQLFHPTPFSFICQLMPLMPLGCRALALCWFHLRIGIKLPITFYGWQKLMRWLIFFCKVTSDSALVDICVWIIFAEMPVQYSDPI